MKQDSNAFISHQELNDKKGTRMSSFFYENKYIYVRAERMKKRSCEA